MSGTISFQPYVTTAPQNSFLLETQGYVEGLPLDDTVSRLWLAEGVLASTETLPMWGGVPITEMINVTGTGADGLGPQVKRATAQGNVTGFSTYLQMSHMVVTAGNTAPLASINDSVGFFRLGSNQRLMVKCDPALVTALESADEAINAESLYWDVAKYWVTLTTTSNWQLPTSVKLLSVNSNSKITSYDSGTGVLSWTTGAAAVLQI